MAAGSESYFAAAGGVSGGETALTAGLKELDDLKKSLYEGPKLNGGGQRNNVIIPETGAAKYWYVDPRAQQQQFAQQVGYSGFDRGIPYEGDIPAAASRNQSVPRLNQGAPKPYDPMEKVRLGQQQEAERMSATHQMGPEDVYKTVTMDLGNKKTGSQQWEVPAVFDNMTDQERNIIHYLPHTQWPKDILNKIETNARDNLEQGLDPYGNPPQAGLAPKGTPNILQRKTLGNAPRLAQVGALSGASQQALEWNVRLDDAWMQRAKEIPPILDKLPGQYQNYYRERYEQSPPVKRSDGRRYFDPQSLANLPMLANDDRKELLKDIDNAIYGSPPPTPTPTPQTRMMLTGGPSAAARQMDQWYSDMVHSYFQRAPSRDYRYNPDPESGQFQPRLVPEQRPGGRPLRFDPYSAGWPNTFLT